LTTLETDLSETGQIPFRGYIDVINAARGVQGWAVDITAPGRPPALTLHVGSVTAARTIPDRARDDISAALGRKVSAGFGFDAETLRRAAGLAATPDDLVTVCIAGTEFRLGSDAPPPRVRDLNLPATDSADDWRPGQTHGIETSVDRILVVPGLGCMVEGWVLSPRKPVAGFALRIGGRVLMARADAMFRKPRADLLAAFPDAGPMLPSAGFVALFAGDMEPPDHGAPMLRVMLEGGATADFFLPGSLPRLLGHTAAAADALQFFPALAAETFFADFATAVVAAQRAALVAPVPLRLVQTPRSLIVVLPEERSDLFLAFETIAAACREDLVDGLTMVAVTDANRADAPWLLDDLLASHPVPASLLTVRHAGDAFLLLPEILRMVGAKRFCYVAAGLFPGLAALRVAAGYLRGAAKAPMFLGPQPDPFAQPDRQAFPSSRCFAWNAAAFLRWSASATDFLGGHYRDNLLARGVGGALLHPDIVAASRSLTPPPIEQAVNAALYAAAC
jgi:hypothetical protein